jgi:hypothetical protein
MANNLPKTRGHQPEGEVQIMSHNNFRSERALTSLRITLDYQLPNNPTAYLAIPDCSSRATAA